jgi:RNA polymerase sigma-70 factor, ECF subfamily
MPNPAALTKTARRPLVDEGLLVERARTEANAFATLYDRYVERVYRYAYRRLGVHAEAEDLTAQTFQRVLESLPHYQARGLPFGAWVFRIAHNLVVDRYRGQRSPLSLDEAGPSLELESGGDGIDAELAQREEIDAAWQAVDRLPPLQRRAVVLRFGRNLSHAEIGPIIGRSEAATKQLIYRAMKTLRSSLQAIGEPS